MYVHSVFVCRNFYTSFFSFLLNEFQINSKEEMAKHLVENTDLHAMYQSNDLRKHDLAKKHEQALKQNLLLQQTVDALKKQLEESEVKSEQRYNDLLKALSQLSKKVNSSSGNSKQEDFRNNDNKLDTIRKTLSDETKKVADLDLRFQLHENSTIDGSLIWKINDFENRTNDAIIGKIRALHSAPCFTEKYGYKFCLRLYVHGDGMGRGTHLSLFLVIMKSEYDDILQWPFQKKIKFRLINQKDRSKDHVEQMSPSKDSSSFQKPTKDMNIASGCPLFISLDRLQPEGFLKNGNLFIEVKVE